MSLGNTAFKKIVYDHYKKCDRDFPWRHTKNPYHIFVAEIMLQQTQADRVVEKYKLFLKTFPTIQKLSRASTTKLYGTWKGLGYNRRVLALKKAAIIIVKIHKGKIPNDQNALENLPGVGPYTASAIRAFAFNESSIVIETNIRTVYIFHFFKDKKNVTDTRLLSLIEKTVDTKNPRLWYTALMDYGAMLKKEHGNFSRRSVHHTMQSPFKDSRRETRGAILRLLEEERRLTTASLSKKLQKARAEISSVLTDLTNEGFTKKSKSFYCLA